MGFIQTVDSYLISILKRHITFSLKHYLPKSKRHIHLKYYLLRQSN
jgi:hypothetical protein